MNQLIVWIPNGVDLTIYRDVEDRQCLGKKWALNSKKLLFIPGRLSAGKGCGCSHFCLCTLGQLLCHKLYIIGDGPDKASA